MNILKSLIVAGLALGAFACDSSVTTSETNNTTPPNNVDPNNTQPECAQNSECPSGLCQAGKCFVNTGINNTTCPNGEVSECGNCDPNCTRDVVGGPTNPFVLNGGGQNGETSQGVVLDENGAITIDIQRVEAQFIWISNTGQGTVSKVDTRTFEEVGRYYTGPAQGSNDPSRTSVNTFGDVFVANRSGQTVSKISALGQDCPDTNNDGVITTSTGANDVLPWGQDDCVLWNTPLNNGGILRAIAAQDVRQSDDTLQPAVWVGGWGGTIWKLSSDSGQILLETNSPVSNYGFALDGRGNLWVSGWTASALGRIDTNKCTTTANCADAVCNSNGDGSGDACIKERIALPHSSYGITVDFKQRVWVGGNQVLRYDPTAAAGQRTVTVNAPFIHGIAADDKGFVWGAGMGSGVIRYVADDPAQNVAVPGTALSSKGMAVDLDGKIWSINQSNASATVIVPGATLNDHTATTPVTNLVSPYTYSDMTGSQLRFATNERGYYRRVFTGCDTTVPGFRTDWQELRWEAQLSGASSITFRIRAADTRADLNDAEWVEVATVPPDTSPFDLSSALEASGLQGRVYIEVEAALTAVRDANNNVYAPKLQSIELTHSCPQIIN